MIHIAYSVWNYYKRYYIYTGISMTSVMENTKAEVCFHILHDETLGAREQAELQRLCANWHQPIVFHFVRLDERFPRRELYGSGYGDGIFFRLYLPALLPELARILYLDSDTIVSMDIESLWQIDLQGKLAGAVWDPPRRGFPAKNFYDRARMQPFIEQMDWNTYFNSGVMLMDLDSIRRRHDLVEESLRFFERFPMRLPDQDALNWILKLQVKLLDSAYNTFTYNLRARRENAILHYTKCLYGEDFLDEFDQLVLAYWEKSVWFDASLGLAEKARMLTDMKSPEPIKQKIKELGYTDWDEEQWRETLAKWENQAADIPVNQAERCAEGRAQLREKQYARASETFKECLHYGTEEANAISLACLYLLTKCAFRLGDLEMAERYNCMAGVLAPESEAYRVNRLLIEWKRQTIRGQKRGALC